MCLALATSGAGGDLQPLLAVALGLRARGHDVVFLCDASASVTLRLAGVEVNETPERLALGPRLVAAVREALDRAPADPGPIVRHRLTEWATELAPVLRAAIDQREPDIVVTSLFGVEALALAGAEGTPRCVINSTFYIGPDPPRDLVVDFAPRAVSLVEHYSSLFEDVSLVLHATDQVFDLSFSDLPPNHHYVGPLGTWEPPSDPPSYLSEPGPPWVLATISSQLQDDRPLAEAILRALDGANVRAVLTTGGSHQPGALPRPPSNARVESYVGHGHVLARASALVSHAGHGSVMKALTHGVPMLLIPWGRDQPGVAFRAERLGVAIVIPRNEAVPGRLRHALDLLLEDPSYRDAARVHAERLAREDTVDTATALVEGLMGA